LIYTAGSDRKRGISSEDKVFDYQETNVNMYQNPEEQFGGSENEGIYSIIKRQCRLTPNYIALKSSSYIMTYSKMEKEIEKLYSLLTSSLLKSHKGEQEKPIVAIQIPNSVSYAISLLAV
jgi:acyl-CoA synthetase (AMP-forming)/AMP-acid ligase II